MSTLYKLPTILTCDGEILKQEFRHQVALVKGGKVLAHAASSLAGCRYLQNNLGRSCHAEINACKQLPHQYRVCSRKVAKGRRL